MVNPAKLQVTDGTHRVLHFGQRDTPGCSQTKHAPFKPRLVREQSLALSALSSATVTANVCDPPSGVSAIRIQLTTRVRTSTVSLSSTLNPTWPSMNRLSLPSLTTSVLPGSQRFSFASAAGLRVYHATQCGTLPLKSRMERTGRKAMLQSSRICKGGSARGQARVRVRRVVYVVETAPGLPGVGWEDWTVCGVGEVDDVGQVELVLILGPDSCASPLAAV